MTPPLLVTLPGHEALAESLCKAVGAERCELELRRFPDAETYLRYVTPAGGRKVVILAALDHPDPRILPLVFAAAAARDLGAAQVGLVSPYLPYMRQDRRFREGEAVTSAYFARILSSHFDWLVTVDPHLHRHENLAEIYSIASSVVHAAPLMSEWIRRNVEKPLIIGPDSESEQWVKEVAQGADAPYIVLEKVRRGDFDVDISVPDLTPWRGRTPVLVDDIASSAQTMIRTLGNLDGAGLAPAICVVVHGIFGGDAYQRLIDAGAAHVITCNTVPHQSNAIDVAPLLAQGLVSLGESRGRRGGP